jgi:hypothetical protein
MSPVDLLYQIRWRWRSLWPRLHRRLWCSRAFHSYPLITGGLDQDVGSVCRKWWSVQGERVYGRHCRHCGHYDEMARVGSALAVLR